MPGPSHSDWTDTIQRYDDLTYDVSNSSHKTFENNLARFVSFLNKNSVISWVTKPWKGAVDFEGWWEKAQGTRGSMVGSGKLDWPLEDDARLSLQLRLIEAMADGTIPFLEVSTGFLYGGKYLDDSVREIVRQLFDPFSRDLRRRLENAEPPRGIPTVAELVTEVIAETTRSDRERRVFLVHGHDATALERVARFLERLGLDPVILSERPNEGRTIIEKFEEESDVAYAIVLMTPDDVGHPTDHPELALPRARQNVVLELGYFVGTLSRGRVCALRMGEIEVPSDLHGLLYLEMDNSDGWKLKLAKELKQAGLDVDMNKAV